MNQMESPTLNDLKPLIVVSGFPRTGTSTMMRMLHLGGIEVFAEEDHQSGRHEFDPYGDFELVGENLSKFKQRSPESTAGKAVKIIAPLIPEACPIDRPVKVIFMLRDYNEIIASLLAMRVVWEWTPPDAVKYARDFLEFHNIPTKYIWYADMFSYPRTTALAISDWLGLDADEEVLANMAGAVDRKARTRIEGKSGRKRLLTYKFDRALVDDKFEISLKEGSKDV